MAISLLTPTLAFVTMVTLVYAFFKLVGRLWPHTASSGQALDTYACGEAERRDAQPFEGVGPEHQAFFLSALLFTITEACTLLLITLPAKGKIPVAAFVLCLAVVISSVGLLGEIRGGISGGGSDA